MKPIWLLDIDGVLNAVPFQGNHPWGEMKRVRNKQGFKLTVSPAVIEFINDVHNAGLVEIVWNTMWQDQANTDFAPLFGLPTNLTIGGKETHPDDWDFKMPFGYNFMHANPERRIIWTDDDLPLSEARNVHEVANGLFEIGNLEDREMESILIAKNRLFIQPETHLGLLPEHIEAISRFILS
jgi:hypothetical protein